MQSSKVFILSPDARVANAPGVWVNHCYRYRDYGYAHVSFVVPRHFYASLAVALNATGAYLVCEDRVSHWFSVDFVPISVLRGPAGLDALRRMLDKKRVRDIRLSPPKCGRGIGMQRLATSLKGVLLEHAEATDSTFGVVDPLADARPRRHLSALSAIETALMLLAQLKADTGIDEAAQRKLTDWVSGKVLRSGEVQPTSE